MPNSVEDILDGFMQQFMNEMEPFRIHGRNISHKYFKSKDFSDLRSRQALCEVAKIYVNWRQFNDSLVSPISLLDEDLLKDTVRWRVKAFNEYRNFINQEKYALTFDSRSNLHSSTLEEFIYYLFRDISKSFNQETVVGKSKSYKGMYFSAESFQDLVEKPEVHVEQKDHDFIIGAAVDADFNVKGSSESVTVNFDIPAVAIECKTYIDKTMLEGASNAAEQLKAVNPNARYYIVAEYVKISNDINFKKYKVDQIFILRKQKNKDRKYTFGENSDRNPIFFDPVYKLVKDIYEYLTEPWEASLNKGIERGYLIPE